MALLFESGQSLDAILSVMGLGANNNQEAELYHTQQSLQEIQAWWDLWKKHNQNVTFQMLAEVAETLKPTAYPDSGNIFLKKVREIWLTQRHIKSILVRSSSRPVMGQEGENRNENVKALALSLASLPAPTPQQKAQPHNTSQLQYRGSTPHAVLYLSIKPNSLSPYDIQHHHLCVYHDRQEPLHRQHLDDLAQILNNIYIVTQSTWKRVENSILSSHLFKRISQWIMEHHSRSNREGCIEFVREKRILRVRCRDSILVNVAYTMSKSDMPSMSDIIMTQKYCLWCSTPRCTLQCVSCKKVWYCGKDCQRQDWSNHKKLCKNKTMTILDHYNETSWKNIIHGTQAKLERMYKPLEGKTQQEQEQEQPGAINDIQNDGDDDDDLKESLFFHVHRYSLTQSQIQRSLKTWLNPVS